MFQRTLAARREHRHHGAHSENLLAPWAERLCLGALPGALAGAQIAGLLFFLNPHLRFEAGTVGPAMLLYGAILGLASALLHLAVLRNVAQARAWAPWALFVTFGLCALLHWFHAARFSLFLPPGMNRRLIKAGIWLSVAATIVFYTALVHSFQRRRYGTRSRIGIAVLALLTLYVVIERREAFRPSIPAAPRPSSAVSREAPGLVVIGVEGGTLDAVLPLAEQGLLPTLQRLMQSGSTVRLTAMAPWRKAPQWATLSTGVLPYRHGLVSDETFIMPKQSSSGPLNLVPLGFGFDRWGVDGSTPVAERVLSRLTAWEICHRLGFRTHRVAWPVPSAEDELADLGKVADGRDTSRMNAAAALLAAHDDSEPIALFVYLQDLEEVSRQHFGGFAAVTLQGSSNASARTSSERIVAAYVELDRRLEQLVENIPPSAIVAVVSPSGFDRRRGLLNLYHGSNTRRGGEKNRTSDGFFVLSGANISPGGRVRLASLHDVLPTLLYGVGLPVARDLDGEALLEVFLDEFRARNAVRYVPSYETLLASPPATRRPRLQEP